MRSKQLSKQVCYCCLSGKVIFFMNVQYLKHVQQHFGMVQDRTTYVCSLTITRKLSSLQGCTNFPKLCNSLIKILGARRVTWRKSHTKDQRILGASAQNLFATATWLPGSVHRCITWCEILTVVMTYIQAFRGFKPYRLVNRNTFLGLLDPQMEALRTPETTANI
jgi:hypothetical protein